MSIENINEIAGERINNLFNYHTPTDPQIAQMQAIRQHAKLLAHMIDVHVPDGADKSAAIRLLRQCVQISNAGIVLDGKA